MNNKNFYFKILWSFILFFCVNLFLPLNKDFACTQSGPTDWSCGLPVQSCFNTGGMYLWCSDEHTNPITNGCVQNCYKWTSDCGTCAQSSSPPSGGGSTFNPGNCGTSYNPTTYLTTDVINGPWVNSNLVMDRLDTLYIKTVPTTNVEINLVNTSNQTGHYIYCAPQPDSVDLSGSFWNGGATVRAFPHNGSCQGDVTCQARPLSVTFKTCVAPTAPTLNSPADGSKISGSTATLTWNDPSSWGDCKTHNYKVYVSTTSTFSGTPTATITGSNVTLPAKTYNFTGIIGQQYFWKVRASNTTDSPDSAVWSFTLLNPPWWQINNGGATGITGLTSILANGQNLDNSAGIGSSLSKTSSSNMASARQSCQNSHGDLVTINDATENTSATSVCGTGPCWIGYNSISTAGSTWSWASNQYSSYVNWNAGEPNSVNDQCANIPNGASNGWNNVPCSFSYAGICELPKVTAFSVPGNALSGGSVNIGGGFSSGYNWQTSSSSFGARLMTENNFSSIKNRLLAYVGPASIASSITSASNLTSGTTQDGVYYVQTPADADITIGSGTLDLGSNKVVLLVNGNVTINSKITLTDGSGYFAILASGNITVNPSIGAAAAVDPTTLTPHLKGVFIAGNTFDFGGGSNQIRIDGSVVGLTGVSLNRNVLGTFPAEYVAFSPNLFMLTPTGIQSRSVTWQEVNP